MSGMVAHLPAQAIMVGPLQRQRCAWCGTILADYDLRYVGVPLGQDGTPPYWPVDEWIETDGCYTGVVEIEDGKYPENACLTVELASAATQKEGEQE